MNVEFFFLKGEMSIDVNAVPANSDKLIISNRKFNRC